MQSVGATRIKIITLSYTKIVRYTENRGVIVFTFYKTVFSKCSSSASPPFHPTMERDSSMLSRLSTPSLHPKKKKLGVSGGNLRFLPPPSPLHPPSHEGLQVGNSTKMSSVRSSQPGNLHSEAGGGKASEMSSLGANTPGVAISTLFVNIRGEKRQIFLVLFYSC